MEPRAKGAPRPAGWTIERAEALLETLTGVLSARVVARPGGEIEEIHLLTTEEVTPKQTVRNVESALLAHFDLPVDHRKISVAQTHSPPEPVQEYTGVPWPEAFPTEAEVAQGAVGARAGEAAKHGGERLLFLGHHIESDRAQRVVIRVAIEWKGTRFEGEASAADLPRARLEAFATATLKGLETVLDSGAAAEELPPAQQPELSLEGVRVIDAFDKTFVLVAVHAIHGRRITSLTGVVPVVESPDRAVILATLQATDRWVRGRL